MVVCGLGRVGTAVAARLKSRGVPVVAIEQREDAVGVLQARQLKIPVIIAPASNPSAQEIAGIARADAVLAVTDDEAVNLEIALVARNANPGVRVVPGCSTTIWPAGWSGGCSSARPAACPCWPRRRSPRPLSGVAAR